MSLLNCILKEDRQKRAHNLTQIEIEELVIRARKKLQETKYAQIGVNAINRELHLYGIFPLPATTIKRTLKRESLQRRKAPYVPVSNISKVRLLIFRYKPIELLNIELTRVNKYE